jgi:Putative Ig domain
MQRSLFLIAFLAALFCSNLQSSYLVSHESDNFFPVARVVLTPVFLSQDAAASLLIEGGPRSYRINGTLGGFACNQHRFKVGGEFLSERLRFHFSERNRHRFDDHGDHHRRDHHHEHRWLNQWAIGGKYQYLFENDCCDWLKSFEASGYYSNAKSKKLPKRHIRGVTFFEHVAGGRSWGLEAGTSLDTMWNCGRLLLAIDYDRVEYKRPPHHSDHHSHDHSHLSHRDHHDHFVRQVSGVGATIALNQPLGYGFDFDFEYQYKKAYDYIEGLLNWRNNMECGDLSVGVFANHFFGKDRLPSSTTVGAELGFSFGIESLSLFGDCCNPCEVECCMDVSDLALWVAEPAVYIPQVLAIAVRHECPPPAVIGTGLGNIGNLAFPVGPLLISLNAYFTSQSGQFLTFFASGLPSGITLNPATGVISGIVVDAAPPTGNLGVYTVTVTATDPCGSLTETFTLRLGTA